MTSNDFKKIIGNSNSIGIAGHVRPDGDCVGSTLAVYNYIASAFPDKNIHIFLEPIPNIFNILIPKIIAKIITIIFFITSFFIILIPFL